MCSFNAQGYRLSPERLSSVWLTLYSVSSCNRTSITVGWTSCGGTSSRGSARRSKPWRTSTGSCWRTSYPPTWPSTFWAATGRTRCVQAICLCLCLWRVDCLLMRDVTPTHGPACFPSILSTPAHLCNPLQCCKPLVALSTLISSILTSVSLSESNYFFPAAVTPSQRWLNFRRMYF